MRAKSIIAFCFIFNLSAGVWATNCLFAELLRNEAVTNNPSFWEGYAKLSDQFGGQIPDAEIKTLLEKLNLGTVTKEVPSAAPASHLMKEATVPPPFTPALQLSIAKRAEKEIAALPPILRNHADEFLRIVLEPGGLASIRNHPGKWNFEKIDAYGSNAYSVRLSGGYRILFDLTKDGKITVLQANKGRIHGN